MQITAVCGPARRAGVRIGESLLAVDGHPIRDVLDYRFYTYNRRLSLRIRSHSGTERTCRVLHQPGEDIGLTFESFLMDGERSCRNRCIFCFIDQNPKGCRESLYYKDDDARLSFLLGNYITLTNLSEDEIERLCHMRISPLGISVHTTDPALRATMLGNPKAANLLPVMERFARAGIVMNAQIVLCPGYNDGAALERTLSDLHSLPEDGVNSVSIVPVGLTKHRQHLPGLSPVTAAHAQQAIQTAARYPRVYPSDEMFLRAGLPIPPSSFYRDYPQLENGVGMMALFEETWQALPPLPLLPRQTLVTGRAAAPFLSRLLAETNIAVQGVDNGFFGKMVDVAGLLCGQDLLCGLQGKDLGERILLPQTMLRHHTDVFLDDMTVPQLQAALSVPVTVVPPDAQSLWDTLAENR